MKPVWFYNDGDTQLGPVSAEKIRALFKSGKLTSETLVWRHGMDDWVELSTVTEFNAQNDLSSLQPIGTRAFGVQGDEPKIGKIIAISTAIILFLVCTFVFVARIKNNEKADALFAAAKDLDEQEEDEMALRKLDEAISINDDPRFYYYKALINTANSKKNEAAFNFEKALEKDPFSPFYNYSAGYFYTYTELNTERGLALLKKSTEFDPRNSEYLIDYATALQAINNYQDSTAVLERLRKIDPENYEVWNGLATSYFYSGDKKKALEIRLEAVKKYPDDAYHWYWLGNAYDHMDNKSEAVIAYRKSIELDPESGGEAARRISQLTGKAVQEKYREIIEDSVPATFTGNRVLIEAVIEGQAGTFLLDTGAMDSVIYKSFLRKNGIDWEENGPTEQYEVVGGAHISAPVNYYSVGLGRFNLSNVQFAVLDNPSWDNADGIIGMNALESFSVKLDNNRQSLVLSRD